MLSRLRTPVPIRTPSWHTTVRSFSFTQAVRDVQRIDYEVKYAQKLQHRANEQGKSLDELRSVLKEQQRQQSQKLREDRERVAASTTARAKLPHTGSSASVSPVSEGSTRKDSSPVKTLSSMLNLDKILETPHTREQLSALWIAYHQSRSNGTGRGYICAVMDVTEYEKMLETASKYPTFVVPLSTEQSSTDGEGPKETGDQLSACIFYMMQWGFHGPPPELPSNGDMFSKPMASTNPQTSTILFTPLQEYKLRQSFATPYLVLTNYTDLAKSHGVVLLHGEITPSGAVGADAAVGREDGRYMLSQQEAQMLAVQLQRFYLWSGADSVKIFNESPAEFDWKELLKPLT